MPHTSRNDAHGPRLVIAGGGFLGINAALRLQQHGRSLNPRITLVSPHNYMVFQPLLPEVASGSIEPRHAAVPLRRLLGRRPTVLLGEATRVRPDRRTLEVTPAVGEPYEVPYDHLVVGVGSETRPFPVPGLEEHAVGFSTIAEALHLHNAVLSRLEVASATRDLEVRRRALTVVFVGGGYTGVEALSEAYDMARRACDLYPPIRPSDLHWVLVEATDRVLPNLSASLGRAALEHLRRSGVDVRLGTRLEEAAEGTLRLSDGTSLEADTLVWSAGVQPRRIVRDLGVPTDEQGRVVVDRQLRIPSLDGVWAGGDCAAVPSPDGGTYPPTAQHASREGRAIADNILRVAAGAPPRPFRHATVGEMVTLGRFAGVGEIKGRAVTGPLAWMLRRLYYAARMPTVGRRARVALDWLIGALFPIDVVALGEVEHPGRPLRQAFERSTSTDD